MSWLCFVSDAAKEAKKMQENPESGIIRVPQNQTRDAQSRQKRHAKWDSWDDDERFEWSWQKKSMCGFWRWVRFRFIRESRQSEEDVMKCMRKEASCSISSIFNSKLRLHIFLISNHLANRFLDESWNGFDWLSTPIYAIMKTCFLRSQSRGSVQIRNRFTWIPTWTRWFNKLTDYQSLERNPCIINQHSHIEWNPKTKTKGPGFLIPGDDACLQEKS